MMHTLLSSRRDNGERAAGDVTWMLNPTLAPHARTVRFPKNRILGELFIETYPVAGRSLSQMKKLGS
jgi:hypothetical protein